LVVDGKTPAAARFRGRKLMSAVVVSLVMIFVVVVAAVRGRSPVEFFDSGGGPRLKNFAADFRESNQNEAQIRSK
jgi:hypothetical protein